MARGATGSRRRKVGSDLSAAAQAEAYQYPEASLIARPEVGSQARFKKTKPKATEQWEQSATYLIDNHAAVAAFVKNAGLGFAIPYLDNGEAHDYEPDFIIRLVGHEGEFLILETKGYDPRAEIKTQAAQRWVSAVNAAKSLGHWQFKMARNVGQVRTILDDVDSSVRSPR
jgi:hypothetical protein